MMLDPDWSNAKKEGDTEAAGVSIQQQTPSKESRAFGTLRSYPDLLQTPGPAVACLCVMVQCMVQQCNRVTELRVP